MSPTAFIRAVTAFVPRTVLLLLAGLVTLAPLQAEEAQALVLQAPPHGLAPFDGWGTSLCWFANAVGRWPEPARSEIADALFSEGGLALTVVRYNIGGGEAPGHHHMPAFRQMEGFQDPSGAWNWDADAGQRWMLQAALRRGACRLEAFSNSPPYWMTLSGCAAGAEDKNRDNLDPAKEAAFADYLVTVVKHFRDAEGIRFDTLDPMNEPFTNYWGANGNQEGCHFDHASQASLLRRLRATLDREGLANLAISASDETNYERAAESWRSYDEPTRSCVSVVNSHSYDTKGRTELGALIAASGKPLVMSEVDHGGGQPHDHRSMGPALVLARHILDDLNQLHPLRWVFWQAVEDEQGQAGSNNNWGLLHADLGGTSHAWVYTKKYHAFAQFTRYLRPGVLLIPGADERLIAALDRERHRLVIVACNPTAQEQPLRIDLQAFGVKDSPVRRTRTSPTEDQAELPEIRTGKGELNAALPIQSVTTLLVQIPAD
jgi:O-glycosyl hydrolase